MGKKTPSIVPAEKSVLSSLKPKTISYAEKGPVGEEESEKAKTIEEPTQLEIILRDYPEYNSSQPICSNGLEGNLKFVNREAAIIKIGVYHLRNLYQLASSDGVPTSTRLYRFSIYIDQFHGSGKTTTGMRLLEKLRELKAELLNYISVNGGTVEFAKFVEENIDKWLGARYVAVAGDFGVDLLLILKQIASRLGVDTNGDVITLFNNIKSKHEAILLHVDEVVGGYEQTKAIWTNCVHLEELAYMQGIMLQYIITGRNTQMSQVLKQFPTLTIRFQNV